MRVAEKLHANRRKKALVRAAAVTTSKAANHKPIMYRAQRTMRNRKISCTKALENDGPRWNGRTRIITQCNSSSDRHATRVASAWTTFWV